MISWLSHVSQPHVAYEVHPLSPDIITCTFPFDALINTSRSITVHRIAAVFGIFSGYTAPGASSYV